MTTVRFDSDKMELVIKNHSEDKTVCAGVSALVGALAASLTDSEDMLEEKAKIKLTDGSATVSCKPLDKYMGNIQRTYWTILEGLWLISKKYPENLRFIQPRK